jgi:hypothetical protein
MNGCGLARKVVVLSILVLSGYDSHTYKSHVILDSALLKIYRLGMEPKGSANGDRVPFRDLTNVSSGVVAILCTLCPDLYILL